MTKYLIHSLLLVLLLFTSCNGQVKTQLQETVNNSKVSTNAQPKMVKTQGTYTYHTGTGPQSDTSVSISSILEDKYGNIWVATMGEGVYRYDGIAFKNFTVKDSLLTNVIYSILEDKDGNIWFGTTDGATRYNGKSFTNFPFSVIKGPSMPQFPLNTSDSRKDLWNKTTEVWSMVQDKSGKIWFGTTDGIYCYDGLKFTSIEDLDTTKNSSLNIKTVNSIIEDKAGNIWFTSWSDGLCRFDGKSIIKVSPEGFNTMILDRNGNLWLGRRGDSRDAGVYRYNGKTFTKLLSGKGYIPKMTEDKMGNLWFSNVPDGGIIYFNPSTSEIISHFTTKDGLSDNHVSAVTIDKSEKVWFGTNKMTLSRFDGKTFTNYYSE